MYNSILCSFAREYFCSDVKRNCVEMRSSRTVGREQRSRSKRKTSSNIRRTCRAWWNRHRATTMSRLMSRYGYRPCARTYSAQETPVGSLATWIFFFKCVRNQMIERNRKDEVQKMVQETGNHDDTLAALCHETRRG